MKVDSRSQTRLHVHFPYIDGLRGLSIIAVILFHLDAALLPAGFSGVDIFFVISGFVVSASLHGLHFDRFRDFAKFFYARRLRRIVPGLAVVLYSFRELTCLLTFRRRPSRHFLAFQTLRSLLIQMATSLLGPNTIRLLTLGLSVSKSNSILSFRFSTLHS